MAVSLTLDHRCDVQRYTEAAQGYGEKRTAAAHLSGVHCRLAEKSERFFDSLAGQWRVTTAYRLLVPFATDIAAGDRVTNVTDEYGTAVAGNWEVAGVMKRRGQMGRHKSAELNKVS